MTPSRSGPAFDWPVSITEDRITGWFHVLLFDRIKIDCRTRQEAEREAARLYEAHDRELAR